MARRIIIYDKDKKLKFNNNYMTTNRDIYMIHDGYTYNPPYFDVIIICKKDFSDEEKNMCWNMVRKGGKLVTYEKFVDYFKKYKNYEGSKILNDKMIEVKKSDLVINNIINYKYRYFDFGIIGVQKGGTTSLLHNLRKHDNISMSKEEDHIFDLGLGRSTIYERKKHLDYNKIVGFKNPGLLYLTHNYIHLQYFVPNIKLIILLRNPVNRAYSHWNMIISGNYNNNRTFEDSINDELRHRMGENRSFNTAEFHFLQRGLYYDQLIELFKYFKRENILIIISEKMFENEEKYYKMIYNFIGVKYEKIDKTRERIGTYKDKLGKDKYDELMIFFRDNIIKLENLLGYKTGWI